MARKKDIFRGQHQLRKETSRAVISIILFALALLSVLAAFGKAGQIGATAYDFLERLMGIGYFLFPIVLVMYAIAFLRGVQQKLQVWKLVGASFFFVSGLGLINLLIVNEGGILGRFISRPLISLFDVYATAILLVAVLAASILVTFDAHFTVDHLMFWKYFGKKKGGEDEDEVPVDGDDENVEKAVKKIEKDLEDQEEDEEDEVVPKIAPQAKKNDDEEANFPSFVTTRSNKPFVPPPLSLLEKDKGKPETGDIKANANIIKRTLANFGISVEMDEISIGPSVTRYALKPAEGVKLSKIVALNNDLALALAAHPIRIEAPIPGKSLVGIEIPNTVKTTVGLATLLGSDEYQGSEKPLLISMGKGISGKPFFANLAKAPHMLIAGATGSGKSVTIHAVIASLLFRNSPEDLKFIMIDPKRVELTLYNKIPHLLTPVITDPKKSILALKWAAKEMSRRYDVLEKNAVRDIDSYHKSLQEGMENMPYIVIIIDELADIMQTYPRELESAIVRLAQMSRAVGIHLILSTQRPSVNVITGLIKANVPTRTALQVASQIDSRTILDAAGAEKLLGAGDMLFQSGDMAKPIRLQSAYITEAETKKVAKYLADTYKDEIMGEINLTTPEAGKDSIFSANLEDDDMGEEDDMYEQARETVIESGKASTSFLQRKLGIGYSRAARLMDILEKKGVIGPANGAKPREVFGSGGGTSGEQAGDTEEPLV